MDYKNYTRCKKCGYYVTALGAHKQTFGIPCPTCGEIRWEFPVVAYEKGIGVWYKPSTWFTYKLVEKANLPT